MKAFLQERSCESAADIDDTSPLTSPLSSLTLSRVEVATVFRLPLNQLTGPRYLPEHQFHIHPGEAKRDPFQNPLPPLTQDGRVSQAERAADEPILYAALREAKEELGIGEDKVEILGGLGPSARSLYAPRV